VQMRNSLRTRLERLEDRIISESEDKLLPLDVLRHWMNGTISPTEFQRWSSVIHQIITAAELAEEEKPREIASTRNISESHGDDE
jgi:hypothetical protein